jgi:hypothetical protein
MPFSYSNIPQVSQSALPNMPLPFSLTNFSNIPPTSQSTRLSIQSQLANQSPNTNPNTNQPPQKKASIIKKGGNIQIGGDVNFGIYITPSETETQSVLEIKEIKTKDELEKLSYKYKINYPSIDLLMFMPLKFVKPINKNQNKFVNSTSYQQKAITKEQVRPRTPQAIPLLKSGVNTINEYDIPMRPTSMANFGQMKMGKAFGGKKSIIKKQTKKCIRRHITRKRNKDKRVKRYTKYCIVSRKSKSKRKKQ